MDVHSAQSALILVSMYEYISQSIQFKWMRMPHRPVTVRTNETYSSYRIAI